MILTVILSAGFMNSTAKLSKTEIYEKAKAMGMDYPSDFKVDYDKGVKK